MKNISTLILIALTVGFLNSCETEEPDTEKPEIILDFPEAFPVNCDTLYFGESFTFKAMLKDNEALGTITALSIDIHNNFNHHSHSTEITECNLNIVKEPVNPLTFITDFDLPEGFSEYESSFEVSLPASNSEGDYDEGDYHFYISLADKEGWSTQKGLSIKILHR